MKLKDKKIEICKQVTVKDSEGFSTKAWVPIYDGMLWAYFRQLSGGEVYAARAVQATEDVLFQVNYRPDITTMHTVRFRGVFYDITRIDTFESYREDLTLYCTLSEQRNDGAGM